MDEQNFARESALGNGVAESEATRELHLRNVKTAVENLGYLSPITLVAKSVDTDLIAVKHVRKNFELRSTAIARFARPHYIGLRGRLLDPNTNSARGTASVNRREMRSIKLVEPVERKLWFDRLKN